MKVVIHDTTLDGQPLDAAGTVFCGRDCLTIVEAMREQTPFTAALAPRVYMTEVLASFEGDDLKPLPEDLDQAADAFLMRLASRGLVTFLPDDLPLDLKGGQEDKPCADK
jgi:hypothetical protein